MLISPYTHQTLRVVSLSSSKQIQEDYTLINTRCKPFPAQHSNYRGKKNPTQYQQSR